jgi:hypothetical protein
MKHRTSILFFFCVAIFLLTSCSSPQYQYNTLTTDNSINNLSEILVTANVPEEDVETIINYIELYCTGIYANDSLNSGWQTTNVLKELYDYTAAINSYAEQEFDDLNCRQAAFILYHSFFSSAETNEPEILDECRQLPQNMRSEQSNYTVLFGSLPLIDTVERTVLNYWEENDAVFAREQIQLVSLWGAKEEIIHNLHAGILINKDDKIYFFEKTDPMTPYQLSIFETTDDLRNYLLNRTDEFSDMTVLIDDRRL